MKMKFSFSYKLILILSCFGTMACRQQDKFEIIEGDLYFDWLRIGSFYNQPDSIIEKVKMYADTINKSNLTDQDKEYLAMYEILKAEKLLYNPFIDLKLDGDSIVKVYLSPPDYESIKPIHRDKLIEVGKKIRIKAEVRNLGKGLFQCKRIISITEINGETFQRGGKLKIEDYQ